MVARSGSAARRPSGLGGLAGLIAAATLSGCLRGPLDTMRADSDLRNAGRWTMATPLAVPEALGPEGCGAQALAAVLAAAPDPGPAEALSADLPWHEAGATPVDLLLEARRRGHPARIAAGDRDLLAREVAAGRPPLVMLDAGLAVHTISLRIPLPAVMHWAVVTGVAETGDDVLLGAPGGFHHVVGAEDFDRRWARADRCTVLIAPRGPAPAAWDPPPAPVALQSAAVAGPSI